MVRGELFTETGKWKYTVQIDMMGFYSELDINDAVRKALRNTDSDIRGVTDSAVAPGSRYTLVVFEPYHKNAYPVMIKLDK